MGTIPRDFFPDAPCIAKWAAELDNGATVAAAVVNMGENATIVKVRPLDFLRDGLFSAAASYRVEDVWEGESLGTYDADSYFVMQLRPHASKLLTLEVVQFSV